ncbi:MAG: FAD-dependent oxidoreductase [Janthinobacterium lividum]
MSYDRKNYEVIVIGAGMAGHAAALQAAQLGASVLLLEKMADYGGSTAMCGGAFAFAGTRIQHEEGIDDTPALLEADLRKVGNYVNDPAVVHAYAEHQFDTYRWLEALGLRFDNVSLSGGQSVPRLHSLRPAQLLQVLHDALLAAGGEYRANAGVKKLLSEGDAEHRGVVGVELFSGEKIGASGGVVIATGGFSRARDMVARFAPQLVDAKPMGGEGNTGDGLRMAWALGADLVDMGFTKGTFGAPLAEPLPGKAHLAPRLLLMMYRGGIVVNLLGKRFIDESLSYKAIGDACLQQPERVGIQIFDERVMAQSTPMPTVDDYRAAMEAGLIKQADTLEALAVQLGLPAAALCDTVERYNASCGGAVPDEFGRTSLTAGYARPPRIEAAPFYGIACTTGLNSTYCGLRTDANARVLDIFGGLVPGLYATGEVMGGLHGASYLSGSSLTKGCIFGRLAARDAVQRAHVAV